MATYIDALNGDHTDGREQLTDDTRENLQDEFIRRIVSGWGYKDLVSYAHEVLADYYSDMSDEEFTTAVKEVYPDFFEENQ